MDSGRWFSIPGENDFQFQGSRIPMIPISPIPAELQEVSGDGVSSVPEILNSLRSQGFVGGLFQQAPKSNAVAAYMNSNDSVDQNRGFNNWNASLVGINGFDHVTGLYSHSFAHTTTAWSPIPFVNHVAHINSASEALGVSGSATQRGPSCSAAAGSTLPISYSRTNSSVQLSAAASSNLIQDGSYAGGSSFFPTSFPQTNQQSKSVPTLLSNESLSEITWNKKPASTPNYGFPIPQNTNLNSCSGLTAQREAGERYEPLQLETVPEPPVETISCTRPPRFPWNTISNALANETKSFQLAPATPDPSKRMQNQIHETDEVRAARELLPKNDKQPVSATSTINEAIQSQTVMHSPAGLSASTEENGNSYREETQTPQQKKPIRKRHRPKVVTDGKPERTPKPVTPKQEMTKRSSRKRNYVTEGTDTTENTPVHIASKAVHTTAKATVKRSKRALNFDLDGQATDGNHSTALIHQHMTPHEGIWYLCGQDTTFSSESYAQVLTNTSSGSKSSSQQANGAEIIVETLTGILPFDLNYSPTAAVSDEILLPEKQAPIIRSPTTEELIKDELESNVKSRNFVKHPNALLNSEEDDSSKAQHIHATGVGHVAFPIKIAPQSSLQSTTKRHNDLSSSSNVIPTNNKQVREIWRGYQSMDTETHLIGSHFNSLKSYQEILQKTEFHRNSSIHFQEIHKKNRTEEGQNNVRCPTPYLITMEHNTQRARACEQPGSTTNCSMPQPNSGESIPSCSNSNGATNRNNRAGNSAVSKYPIMAIRNSFQEQDTSAELQSQTTLGEGTLEIPKCPEFMLTFSKIERETGKRSKEVTRVRDFASLITIAGDKQLSPTPSKTTPTLSTEQGHKISRGAQA